MFLKSIIKTDKISGKRYEYLRLCESYRIADKTRHRNIVTLGLVPQLDSPALKKQFADRLEHLIKGSEELFLNANLPLEIEALAHQFYNKIKEKQEVKHYIKLSEPEAPKESLQQADYEEVDLNSVVCEQAKEAGSEWLCYQAMQQLGVAQFLEEQGLDDKWINICMIHWISKAIYPASEHKTQQWLQQNSALAELFGIESLKISRHHLYRASLKLHALKNPLDTFLSTKTNELFDIQDKIILYDLTNTYFEGRKLKSELAKFGRSKEKRSDAKLIALALVVNTQGFVKYSKIYKGNIADSATLETTVEELSKATSFVDRKPMVVIDAGIATEKNLEMLTQKGYHYLCVTRSKLKDYKIVDPEASPITLTDKRNNSIEVQRVEKEGQSDAFLYIRSAQKAAKEASMDDRYSQKFEQEITALSLGLAKKGTVKKLEKIWERIGRIKERYPAINKHYALEITSDQGVAKSIQWSIKNTGPSLNHGVYFLRTSKKELNEKDFWGIYNTLTQIEATFRILKIDLNLRPVFHQKDDYTEAHIYLGILAYSLVATIRHQLKGKGINDDWSTIIRKMNTQKIVTNSLKNKQGEKITIKLCSIPNQHASKIYESLQYKKVPFYRKKYVFPD
ncbi:MAG: IS1634 family transposase [Bacteroidota bacterium]|nr:IS1634 family transposase [Bacteroidota bacterium]